MNFDTAKIKLLMEAINVLRESCPEAVYTVTNDSIKKMRVDRVELYLKSGSVILVRKNTDKPGVSFGEEDKRSLTTVILDEDEAVKRWKEEGKR